MAEGKEAIFSEVRRQVFPLADEIAARAASVITNVLAGEVTRMQEAARDAVTLRQTAAAEATALARANEEQRATGRALVDANAALQREAAALQAQLEDVRGQIRAAHGELEKVTAAVVATTRAAGAAAAV
jgi:chromosome segregation ATPase